MQVRNGSAGMARTAARGMAAAVLGLAALTVGGNGASAAVTTHAYRCYGSEVVRCAWINYDSQNHRVRGYVRITDAAGGGNYQVAVNNIRMSKNGNRISTVGDYDDWYDTTDTAQTALVDCHSNDHFVVKYTAKWRRGSESGQQEAGTYFFECP